MRPRRPQSPVHSPRSPQNSGCDNCRRKAKHYSYLVIFGIVVYLEILFLSQWSLESLLNSGEHDSEEISIQKLSKPSINQRSSQTSTPDGAFNGFPVRLQIISNTSHTRPKSNIHCIGENYQEDHWMVRSCNIRFMCFNLKEQEYEIYSRPEDDSLKEWTDQIPTMDSSQTLIQSATGAVGIQKGDTEKLAALVALGGIQSGWEKSTSMDKTQSNELKYFPKVRSTPPSTFYTLPEDVVMIPYHSTPSSTFNPTMSVLWDDYLSVFNLLHIFQFDESYRPLLVRHGHMENDEDIIQATSSLMMRPPAILTSQGKTKLELSIALASAGEQTPKSDLVCAKQGLMGTAALTSYGMHRTRATTDADSGEKQKILRQRRRSVTSKEGMTQNRGRGGLFWKFRLWALQNLGLEDTGIATLDPTRASHKIVLAKISTPSTQTLFETLKTTFSKDVRVSKVEDYNWKSVSPLDQVKILSQTSVLVSSTPEDLATAPFLPNGASLILLYAPKQHTLKDPSEEYWDLINNLSHIRVHWLPAVEGDDGHDVSDDTMTAVELINRALSFDND